MTHITDEARAIVEGERAGDYGGNSLPAIGLMWSVYLGVTVTGRDVANMMVQLKTVRDRHHPKRDNQVDMIGYAILGDAATPEPLKPCRRCKGSGSTQFGMFMPGGGSMTEDVTCPNCNGSGTDHEGRNR